MKCFLRFLSAASLCGFELVRPYCLRFGSHPQAEMLSTGTHAVSDTVPQCSIISIMQIHFQLGIRNAVSSESNSLNNPPSAVIKAKATG